MERITDNNYELWLLHYAEGELTAAECEVVEAWLAEHPVAAEELTLYNEAPHLEANQVDSGKTLSSLHFPLSPILRWSAAAAVVIALMVPALRMETMDHIKATTTAPLVANAKPVALKDSKDPKVLKVSKALKNTKNIEENKDLKSLTEEETLETVAALPDTLTTESAPMQSILIKVNSLIAFEPDEVSGDTLYTTALIIYEGSTDWSDALLAANDAFHEDLNARPLGRFVSRQLPNSQRLKEKVVEPLREKINNVKRIIK
ncbi:MAG: anti-sigma factor family protein [bacterium]